MVGNGDGVGGIATGIHGPCAIINQFLEPAEACGVALQAFGKVNRRQAIHADMDDTADLTKLKTESGAAGWSESIAGQHGVFSLLIGGNVSELENFVGLARQVLSFKPPLVGK